MRHPQCHALIRLTILAGLSGWASTAAMAADPESRALRIRLDKPAANWDEALPLGNGRLGAMVFGGMDGERMQLNEYTLWASNVRGLCARGGFVVDCAWREGRLTEAVILSKRGGTCRVRYRDKIITLDTTTEQTSCLNGELLQTPAR